MDNAIDSVSDGVIAFEAGPHVAAGRARGGRPTQQDDLVCLHDAEHDACLLVLADGMGGDGAGELASAGVVQVARQWWEARDWLAQPGPLFLETLCQQAHDELRRRGQGLAHGEPHATVVALLARGRRLAWAHVGDSRLYRFEGARLLGRTEDHSVAALRHGQDDTALAADPDQHKLLRGLGGPQPPVVEHGCGELRRGQRFVLCSDGVWTQLSAAELGRLSARRDRHAAVREALQLALTRGGPEGDNVALIFASLAPPGWRWRQVVGSAVRGTAALWRRGSKSGAAG